MNALSMMLCGMLSLSAFASTTKVGNGDDGKDLEGAVIISSGPIFESRAKAVALLKSLNVQGIQGLGQLIPELEKTELWLAQSDVAALNSEGSWEISEDRTRVYARTFPEPHAPTRFFPAALKLNMDQLVALHTHEALHRALPPGIREDEEKVSILTMAITSPSANFDRVNQFARSVMGEEGVFSRAAFSGGTSSTSLGISAEPPARKPTRFAVTGLQAFDENGSEIIGRVSADFAPLKPFMVRSYYVAPRLAVEQFLLKDPWTGASHLGPMSFLANAPFVTSESSLLGPFVRFSLASLEEGCCSSLRLDRDVYTLGFRFESDNSRSYSSIEMGYTLPSSGVKDATIINEVLPASKYSVGSIWTLSASERIKIGSFTLGGGGEIHHSRGAGETEDPFTIVRAGPEIQFRMRKWSVGVEARFKLNREGRSLDDLSDLAGHGAGKHTVSGTLGAEL